MYKLKHALGSNLSLLLMAVIVSCRLAALFTASVDSPQVNSAASAVDPTQTGKKAFGHPTLQPAFMQGSLKPKKHFEDVRYINIFKETGISNIRKTMTSPHSELVLGILLGVDNLSLVPEFKNAVRATGTIHVIVVSGYNINFVYSLVLARMGTLYSKRNVLIASLFVFLYTVVSGFDPPVVRAWIMGTTFILIKLYGREESGLKILFFSGLSMLVVNPMYLFSLSFQLSFLASLSLLMFSPMLQFSFAKKNVIIATFFETLSAQILVAPFITYMFSEMSVYSLLVNSLILWVIPICTNLGFIYLLLSFMSLSLAKIIALVIFPFLDMFVRMVFIFGNIEHSIIKFEISTLHLMLYYLLCFLCYIAWSYKRRSIPTYVL